MEHRKSYVLVALFALLLLTDIVIAESDGGKGNGNNGKGNEVQVAKGKGDDYKGKGNGNGPKDKEKEKKEKEEKERKEKEKKEKARKEKEEKERKDKERKEKEKKEKERKEKERKEKEESEAAARYRVLTPLRTGQELAICQARGACYYKILVCPGECPKRRPMTNRNTKGCFIDCTSKCEATCKCKYTLFNCSPLIQLASRTSTIVFSNPITRI